MAEDDKGRSLSNVATDQAALRAIAQAAVDVELFTIPLYMTALYSIRGTYADPDDGPNLWPGRRPRPASMDEPNQLAYNAIFSVYVQEMFHLQLASNIASAVGQSPLFQPPVYEGTTIPCIGDLAKIPGYEDVQVRLGPLDINQVKLFIAIETPDWEAPGPKPAVPFMGWTRSDALPEFATIGHMYECMAEYMDLEYTDGQTLWQKTYDPESVQVDMFNFYAEGHTLKVYPEIPVRFPGPKVPWSTTRKMADTMMKAIIEQGEGRTNEDPTVDVDYVPSENGLISDRGTSDAAVRVFWDGFGHWERFQFVGQILDRVETWPQWWAKRGGIGAWSWQDVVAVPELAGHAPTPPQTGGTVTCDDTVSFAQARARALNDPYTATKLNEALNQSYNSLLAAIEKSWTDERWRTEWSEERTERERGKTDPNDPTAPTRLFPYAAMQALYTRVATIWACNAVPEFKQVTTGELPYPGEPHACQGLSPENPGQNICANAVIHACGGANSCKHQGGCGYPSEPDSFPDVNSCAGQGGCGAPIPVAQVFNPPPPQSGEWTYDDVTMKPGDKVWDKAWEIFSKKFPDAQKPTNPSNVRLVLPPS